jgi:hypothetical protein
MAHFNANASVFVPKVHVKDEPKGIVVFKSKRYMGTDTDFNDIKQMFLSMTWHADVKCVYITNGWHKGFENGTWVTYCGYAVGVDDDHHKQHYYKQ